MKKFIVALMAAVSLMTLTGCNQQIIDTTYKFDRAIIKLPNGEVIDGTVEKWGDYDGEQLQIKIDGKTYLAHSANVVMIVEGK